MKARILVPDLKLLYCPHPRVDPSPQWLGLWSLPLLPEAIGSSFRLRAGCAWDLPAEAAEDGEEPQHHVGQR